MSTFDRLGFAPRYDCEILVSTTVARGEPADVVVRVKTLEGVAWERSWRGFGHHYPLTGAYAAPSDRHLFVIARGAGFHVPVDAPDESHRIPCAPILGVARVPERPIVIFWGFQDLVAYGPDGLLWWLERLSEDDLAITAVEPDAIHGTAWDASAADGENDRVPFRVAPWTGAVEGGWLQPLLHTAVETRTDP